jgi:hypothetical protein
MYSSIGTLLLGLLIVAFVVAFKMLARVQWSMFRSCKGKEGKEKLNNVVFYDEKTCPLMLPVTIEDDNSKMADISVT